MYILQCLYNRSLHIEDVLKEITDTRFNIGLRTQNSIDATRKTRHSSRRKLNYIIMPLHASRYRIIQCCTFRILINTYIFKNPQKRISIDCTSNLEIQCSSVNTMPYSVYKCCDKEFYRIALGTNMTPCILAFFWIVDTYHRASNCIFPK